MKKYLALTMAACMALSLAACGSSASSTTSSSAAASTEATSDSAATAEATGSDNITGIAQCCDVGTLDDESFNQGCWEAVKGYGDENGIEYNYYTTLKGVMEKENPQNPTEFTVPARLKELYAAKDFGRYANERGELPVAFLADCDITGGNSGSPVMNAKGALIGLAFDGNWEAMSGDVAFEPDLQRTISVDIRYVLFIIDKFAGAGWLLDELVIE